jgi:hypothetical protein
LGLRIVRFAKVAADQGGKGGVLEKDGGVPHAISSPVHQLIRFQFRDGQ